MNWNLAIALGLAIMTVAQVKADFCTENRPCGAGDCYWLKEWSAYLCDCINGEFQLNKTCHTYPTSLVCLSNVCKNGAQCVVDGVNHYKCVCPKNYVGVLCDKFVSSPNYCSLAVNICQNGGVCEPSNEASNALGFVCKCPPTYSGVFCEQQITKCAATCLHGKCVTYPGGIYCDCDFGWSGDSCNVSLIGQCRLNAALCKNGGSCVDIYNGANPVGYTCQCPPGYSGTNCEINQYQICNPLLAQSTCENGGLCAMTSTGAGVCSCLPIFQGSRCEQINTALVPTCSTNICRNGGACYQLPNRLACVCPFPFTGQYCESVAV